MNTQLPRMKYSKETTKATRAGRILIHSYWIFFPLLFAACGDLGYKPAAVLLPPHINSIAVRPLQNKTPIFGLEEKFRLRVEQEFIQDGRLPYVNNESESQGVVAGEIVRYIREAISFDANHVAEEFKLWVVINLKFIDRVNNVVLWEEPRMEQEYRYFVETKPGGITEEEAREILWDLFARDIVKRTIEGFGSVSGASERKVSETQPPASEETPTPPAVIPDRRTIPPSPY